LLKGWDFAIAADDAANQGWLKVSMDGSFVSGGANWYLETHHIVEGEQLSEKGGMQAVRFHE
jgi:hypothetical protein